MSENAETPGPDANRFLAWARHHGSELRLAARTTIAALLAFATADLLHMAQIYWAVLTAVIVMQANLGGSIKATFDRLAGTVGGAAWGVIIGLALPHAGALGLALALALAVGPLALAAAFKPWLRIAPVTAIIVLMSTQAQQAGPLAYALDRVIEILLGVAVALAVSLLVLPNRAHGALATAASRALQIMSELAAVLLPHPGTAADGAILLQLHAKLRRALAGVDVAGEEARRERVGRLTDEPEPEPLRRNLNRLRLDLAMIGRATVEPLPEPVAGRLAGATADVAAALAAYFSAAGLALAARRAAPPREACSTALRAYAAVLAELRKEGLTRNLSAADARHLFGIAFVLDQLRRNLRDLAERVDEMAGQPRKSAK
ncbi:MAG TPA: FUSC family protein [Candidatus Udaeobacter sp.]|nr:FUSC family protein [Candidatus Udaeobacter sp.]